MFGKRQDPQWLANHLTGTQEKVVAALAVLERNQYHSRWKIAATSRGEAGPGFPIRIMRTLQYMRLVEPEHAAVAEMVEQQRCKCGCDAWRLTELGRSVVKTMNIHTTKEESC
jgi:hypothetical protein